ncbi:MAG: DoxX family protein [Gemmatimonadaceae bacterium]
MNATFEQTARGVTHALLRMVAGLMFWQHGAQKLFGWLDGRQVQDLASQSGLAGVLEFFGGILIIVGLFTRPVAFILSGEMAFAYFLSHAPRALWPIMNRGEASVLFCFIFLFFAAQGAGPYSLDSLICKRRPSAALWATPTKA